MNKPTKEDVLKILSKSKLTSEDREALEHYEPNEGQDRAYSFYTPVWLCEVMLDLAIRYGFDPKKGKVLEPSCGNGNFLSVLPEQKNVTAFELSELNSQIAQKRAPDVTIFNQYFETAFMKAPRFTQHLQRKKTDPLTWLESYPFDLVIGNPPYGNYTGHYSRYFKPKFKRIEQFFMYKGLELLKPDGLLVFITMSSFMRNDLTYNKEKSIIGEIADFVDAYRMPKVFKNTEVPTDILIFRRK